ncbi:ATP-grasp domain-containing protein [Pectinatus frisingensis]|uniref:ATP-grasp domain-containing protein n=1 Tax=Pectinatus frisingensis TaxID=865 RepID=UPI003D8029A1
MKKILLLGGSRYLLPAIQSAHDLGVYVITCDYLPNNYAHKFSDEYHNISIVDKKAVLILAEKLKIDGIISYATDPGVVTAAYVAKKMGLSGIPYESAIILQNKGKFRRFLEKHGFNTPTTNVYHSWEEIKHHLREIIYPVIVKPTDSAGSKGVTRVDRPVEMFEAVSVAIKHSFSHEIIVEQFIEKSGFSSDTDSFSIDGDIVFFSLNDQWFDQNAANVYTPAAFCWPSTMPIVHQKKLHADIQRLLCLLHMGTSIYNIETRLGVDGKPYIMEVSPRAGGNRLAEVLRYACGQDIIRASIQGALGMTVDRLIDPLYQGYWGLVVLHSRKAGIYKNIYIDNRLDDKIIEKDMWVVPGDEVKCFTGANESIGTLVLHSNNQDELMDILTNIEKLIMIEVQ